MGSLPIIGITVLAGVLRLVTLGGTLTNPFYDAAVRSMGESWHNFFFAAFEPAAGTSIDKPPVDLWLQVASVKLFGLGPTALILPQALAATLAVPLLYDLVRRLFGRPAGLAAALCLAVLPISVMTARSDTMDSLMMALNVLAAWLVVRSAQSGRLAPLIWAGAVVGINFEVKLFEALLALPALGLLYLLASRAPLGRRLAWAGLASVVLVVVALAWPAIVSLTPSHSRPYPIGSSNGSVWNAIFVFNGRDRLNPPRGTAERAPVAPRVRYASDGLAFAAATIPVQTPRIERQQVTPPRTAQVQGVLSAGSDPPGLGRLFGLGGYHFGQDIGVELAGAFALGGLAMLAGALAELRRRTAARRVRLSGGVSYAPRDPPSLPLTQAAAIAFAAWLLIGFYLFSRVRGVLHPRYLEAMTPAVAVALGVGAVACFGLARRSLLMLGALLAALALCAAYAVHVAASDHALAAVVLGATALSAIAATAAWLVERGERPAASVRAGLAAAAIALALVGILAPAAARSHLIVSAHASDSGSPGAESKAWVDRLSAYLRAHDGGAYYEVAAASYPHAAPLIVHDGRPVLVLTSYGQVPVVGVSQLAAQVRAGRIRYALIEGYCGTSRPDSLRGCPKTIRWLRQRSVDVTADTGLGDRGVLFRITGVKPSA